MSLEWTEYRSARRRSRQAWVLVTAGALAVVVGIGWFFTVGQFLIFSPSMSGPSEVAVLDSGWMGPVRRPHQVPRERASVVLELLAVKDRASSDGYDRDHFGQAWADVDRNGCDTRNDILRRDLAAPVFAPQSRCTIVSGAFREPYTGANIEFTRGAESSKVVQIDHVVALGDAWQKGAQEMTLQQRQSLANDPLNLIAADGTANQDKGAGDASQWLPPNRTLRCHYVARQISVKTAYGLWVTQAERNAMRDVLGRCPEQQTIRPEK